MRAMKILSLLLAGAVMQMTLAKTSDLVLQNGLNGYNGASDTYMDSEYPQNNFSATSSFKLRDETIVGG